MRAPIMRIEWQLRILMMVLIYGFVDIVMCSKKIQEVGYPVIFLVLMEMLYQYGQSQKLTEFC